MKTDQDLDEQLMAMFAAQREALEVPHRDWSEVESVATPRRPRRGYATSMAVLAAFVAVFGVAAVSLLATRDEEVRSGGAASTSAPVSVAPGFAVETRQVSLAATSLAIEVGGTTFATATPLEVSGDPGTRDEYTTLELTWREHQVEMRLNIYFKSDGREWWSDEIRTYDGRRPEEWITYTGDFFRRPLGTPFAGDFEVSGSDHGVQGRLHLPGLRLEAFRRAPGCLRPKTPPYVLDPNVLEVQLPASPEASTSVEVTLLDAATCQPAPNQDDAFDYRWSASSPIAAVQPSGRRSTVQGLAPGGTVILVTARSRASGQSVAWVEIPIDVVAPSPDASGPSAGSQSSAGGPPAPLPSGSSATTSSP